MNFLVTGGCGFIGANFVHYLLRRRSDSSITVLDKLTYAGNLENIEPALKASAGRLTFVRGDIGDASLVNELMENRFDVIVNFAAESHVDRSIEDAGIFLRTNVLGTQTLLEGVRRHGGLFVQVSTDEVYGSLEGTGRFNEDSPLAPNSP